MNDVVFERENIWFPRVIRQDGELRLELAAGADALHDPRCFSIPIEPEHLQAIRDDLTRHLMVWSVLDPLWYAAGIDGPLDEQAAVALLGPALLGTSTEADALFATVPWDRRLLIAHGADGHQLDRGKICAALVGATVLGNPARAAEDDADRDRAARGVVLNPLDRALLLYTGRLLHRGTRPRRNPAAVDAALLPDVLQVIDTAEQAGARLRADDPAPEAVDGPARYSWHALQEAVASAVRRAHPDLVDDVVQSVSGLMCTEDSALARTMGGRSRNPRTSAARQGQGPRDPA